MSGAGEVNGKNPVQQTNQTGAQQNIKPAQETKPGNVPVGQSDNKAEDRGIRQDMGNGITKITHADGTNEFEIDYAKGYDGKPQLFAEGTKVTYLNAPQEKDKFFAEKAWDAMDEWVDNAPKGPIKAGRWALAGLGKIVIGVVSIPFALTSCSRDNSFHQEVDYNYTITTDSIPGTPDTVIPGNMTAEEFDNAKTQLFDSVIDSKNKENPTTTDGVGYKYQNNGDGTGSVVIKNKDGSDSNLKLGFSTDYQVTDEKTDPKTGDFSCNVTLTGKPTSQITNGNVYDYIQIIGDKFNTADNVGYKFTNNNGTISVSIGDGAVTKPLGNQTVTAQNNVDYINKIGDELQTSTGVSYSFSVESGKAKVTYGTTGFTHIVGEPAAVDPSKPLGRAQSLLTDLGILPNMGDKIATETQTTEGAWGTGKGVHFEVVPGDLKQVTQGNPTVKMAFNDMQGHNITIEGKLEINGNGIKITAPDGKVLTINPQNPVEISDEEYAGATVSYNGEEVFRMAKENFNGREATILAHVQHDPDGTYTDTDTNFSPNPPKEFDGKKVVTESDAYYTEKETNLKTAITEANTYFDTKKINLEAAYKSAVDAIYGKAEIKKEGTIIPGTPGTPGSTDSVKVHTESDVTVKIY